MKLQLDPRHTAFVAAGVSGIVLIDQAVKAFARTAGENMGGRIIANVIPNVFELKLVFNKGIAFGMAQGGGVWLTPIAILVCLVALFMTLTRPKESRLQHVTMVALAAGSLGNLIDRLRFQQVTDMFSIRLIDFPVFNVADVSITVAGVLLVYSGIMEVFAARKDPATV
ncbi:MAG: signal peptidase II [Armatimonadota bacterium]